MKPELYEESYQSPKHFSFGKNWQHFLKNLNNTRVQEAENSLVQFLGGKQAIKNKTFVDIGCGSGLFSLAAYRLGAKEILSVDVDTFSLSCVKYLWEKAGQPANWSIKSGSVLDATFMASLGTFDIVYSWGVLHHTGNLKQALLQVQTLVGKEGKLYIAIYNDNPHILEGTSAFWVRAKRLYNRSPWLLKKIFDCGYTLYYLLGLLFSGKNPVSYVRHYHTLRGMSFFTDVRDWLGGYPYEFATAENIIERFEKEGYHCANVQRARSIGCNEFLFLKKS